MNSWLKTVYRVEQHGRSQPGPVGSRAPKAHPGHLGHCPHHPGHHCHHDLLAAVPGHCGHHLSHAGSSCPQWCCLRSSQEGQGRGEGSIPSPGLLPSQNSSRRDFGVKILELVM